MARGLKAFKETEPHPAPGETFSLFYQPIQGFQWADYSAKPEHLYTYKIVCMYGNPSNLEARREVQVTVQPRQKLVQHIRFFSIGDRLPLRSMQEGFRIKNPVKLVQAHTNGFQEAFLR